MREILFRGKCQTGEWVCGGFVSRNGKPEIVECDRADDGDFTFTTQVDPTTVGQFTGFTDKNGKRIFEGDILYIEDDDGNKYVTKVWYERGGLVIDVKGCDYDYTVIGWLEYYYSMEVIGNIHDNPDLIAND